MRLDELGEVLLLWGIPSEKGMQEIREKVQANRGACVLVPEMRPHCLGLEIAKKLREEGINHTYATDNMLGILFYKRKVTEVLFFYQELVDHHFWGICGSLYVCLLAQLHNVPIQPRQGDTMIRSSQDTSLLDDHMRFQYNNEFKAEDEAVPEDVLQ